MPPSAPGSVAPRAWLLLALLTLAAFGIRAAAVPRLLPHAPEPDAYVVHLAQDLRGDPALVQHVDYAQRYPTLLARTLALLPWPGLPDAGPVAEAAQAHLRAASGPYLAGRWWVLLLSIASVPLTWVVGRRLAGERAAWLASALMATSLMHALFSTQARPHGPQAALALAAVWLAMRMAERPSLGRCAAAALLASLALASLQIGAATLPPLALAAWLAGGTWRARALRAVVLPVLAVLGALWAYPFELNWGAGGVRLGGSGGHEIVWANADLSGFGLLAGWLADYDPTLCALAVVAVALAVATIRASARAVVRDPDATIACGYVLPYLCVVGSLPEVLDRFGVPLLPWLAILGAAAIAGLVRRLGPGVFAAASFAVLLFPCLALARFVTVSIAPDSLQLAARWLLEQPDAAEQRVLGSPGLVLPVPYERETLRRNLEDSFGRSQVWTQYQGALPEPGVPGPALGVINIPAALAQGAPGDLRAWLDANRPGLVVFERSARNQFLPGGLELRRWIHERGDLVYQTGGEAPGVEALGVLHYQAIRRYAWRLLSTQRLGSPIEIWRIREPSDR